MVFLDYEHLEGRHPISSEMDFELRSCFQVFSPGDLVENVRRRSAKSKCVWGLFVLVFWLFFFLFFKDHSPYEVILSGMAGKVCV